MIVGTHGQVATGFSGYLVVIVEVYLAEKSSLRQKDVTMTDFRADIPKRLQKTNAAEQSGYLDMTGGFS